MRQLSLSLSRSLTLSSNHFPTCFLFPRLTRNHGGADTLLEKMQSFTTSTYGPDAVGVDGLETMHYERMGDVAERIDALTITKRFVSTGESALVSSTCQPVSRGFELFLVPWLCWL